MKTLDCRDLKCPHPVIETRKVMMADPAKSLRVLVGDTVARDNVARLASKEGYQATASDLEGGFALDLVPVRPADNEPEGEKIQGRSVVYVDSDCMGSGSDELGGVLMRNFIMTLTELEKGPDAILFVNAGAKLTTEGSQTLEALERLAATGTDVATCGLCLDFFGLKEKVRVGRITNMLDIVETLSKAGRIIQP